MPATSHGTFQERVECAAEAVLKTKGSVGPLDLFQEMRFLPASHVELWRKGDQAHRTLEQWIQVGPEKCRKTIRYFNEWVQQRGLRPLEATFSRQSPHGLEPLPVTAGGDPEREKFFRTHYVPADLSESKGKRLAQKLNKTPDLVVFEKVSEEGHCSECQVELGKGNWVFMEKGQPLCLTCADLDHLVFLPAGNTAMSRRARKHSPLSAVLVRFSRARRRYERQGLLVTANALAQAEVECQADATDRAAARRHAAGLRAQRDREFVKSLAQAILAQYPGCPLEEAYQIARHTGQRNSGRVGRSAAARALDPKAIKLAITAHVRHQYTNYDDLLMQGVERLEARRRVRDHIDQVLNQWLRSVGDHTELAWFTACTSR